MSSKDQFPLQVFVPVPLVKRARGDEVFALDAEVLGQDGAAVEGVEGDVGAAGEEDGAGDVVDAGALRSTY